jgi:hypothetical protein
MALNLYRFYLYTVFMAIRSLTTYWQIRSLATKLLSAFAVIRAQSNHKYKQAGGIVINLFQNETYLKHISLTQPPKRIEGLHPSGV